MSSKESGLEKQNLTEYRPIGSLRKVALLLQRSWRYSYRRRTCRCIPHLVYEFFFPLMAMVVLVGIRCASNEMGNIITSDNRTTNSIFFGRSCPQDLDSPLISSENISSDCFLFPPSFAKSTVIDFSDGSVSTVRTAMIFEPMTDDANQLALLVRKRYTQMGCFENPVRSVGPFVERKNDSGHFQGLSIRLQKSNLNY